MNNIIYVLWYEEKTRNVDIGGMTKEIMLCVCVYVCVISMAVVHVHVLHTCVYVRVCVYENTETRDACLVLSFSSLFLCNRFFFF